MTRQSVSPDVRHLFRYFLPLLLTAACFFPAQGALIQAIQGEVIPLGGIATGADVLYLFLTGPNLPPQGISLVGGTPVITGDPSSFTRVEVLTDGTWSYRWRTGDLGRILDPGSYVLYAVEEPRARPDLDDASYTTQAIVFGPPVETQVVTSPPEGATLSVNSTPGMSVATLDGRPAGTTPLTITGISPGSHTLVISHEGYADYLANFNLSAGQQGEISAMLRPLTSAPPPAPSSPSPPPTTPGRLASVPILAPVAAALAVLALRRRG